ncbi:pantoate--beta-alanine ligase [Magnetospirillum sulfuroxidans]|uniref:Pantothenate synthetase n=1 Tax=Magnetospirillum sulfuroxidans TaxID=611300 RepID=A0ABS5II23_9PROT|nr:pantoate--beta-alanine ligase [Magnetospirillum sulfuroxidans]MBR9973857.1 pantoate--beta-alanine ligase [Magnetospirillum sulfuroxidans]
MSETVDIIRSVAELRARVRYWRDQGLSVALVPTMGALHDGHLTLVKAALELADRVVTSVFVNPTQFGPNEDFSRYPRQEEQDAGLLADGGCHVLYAPTVTEMYPAGFATSIHVGAVSEGLCGDIRPGHFDGVATVVTKLLLQCQPHLALFGEKDWQQLTVLRHLVRDLDLPVEVVGVPTVREVDGLARSSRNAYLSAAERSIAPVLFKVLNQIADGLRQGGAAEELCRQGIAQVLEAGFLSVDYLEVRAADTLERLTRLDQPARILVAARLHGARLIDNLAVEPAHA